MTQGLLLNLKSPLVRENLLYCIEIQRAVASVSLQISSSHVGMTGVAGCARGPVAESASMTQQLRVTLLPSTFEFVQVLSRGSAWHSLGTCVTIRTP